MPTNGVGHVDIQAAKVEQRAARGRFVFFVFEGRRCAQNARAVLPGIDSMDDGQGQLGMRLEVVAGIVFQGLEPSLQKVLEQGVKACWGMVIIARAERLLIAVTPCQGGVPACALVFLIVVSGVAESADGRTFGTRCPIVMPLPADNGRQIQGGEFVQ
ncbi:hypothetical protein [Pseudomonas sp. JUb96]|uniref:hypothetical protein n=1 Tax=Pseudomonas sp. JUb96 TaxID=2940539 RepID=UPI002227CFF4|nr:hypothetical protein [Pseudomonas sp. JUb96]MCW2270054.1 hypothetical protein [Pseudomonas sp. JUb96]